MNALMVLWLGVVVAGVLAALCLVAAAVRRERRRNRAFIEHLRRIGRRCPACQPWGGWYLGRMREDGSYETYDCEVCGGTGELPESEVVGA